MKDRSKKSTFEVGGEILFGNMKSKPLQKQKKTFMVYDLQGT